MKLVELIYGSEVGVDCPGVSHILCNNGDRLSENRLGDDTQNLEEQAWQT